MTQTILKQVVKRCLQEIQNNRDDINNNVFNPAISYIYWKLLPYIVLFTFVMVCFLFTLFYIIYFLMHQKR